MDSKRRSQLKSLAQKEKALFQVGNKELHQSFILGITEAFNTREILKIKVNRLDKTNKTLTKEIALEVSNQTNSEIVDIIGTTIILYKEIDDKPNQKRS
ncbi:MAG: YhbY family RNA-binding protein [Mycoplasmatales bacterium]